VARFGRFFLVMDLSYAFGVLTLYALRHAGESAPLQREPMLENILNYFRALKSNRVMLSLMISTAAAETLGFSHQVILPILAREVLQVGAVGLGVLTAFRFVGGALGVVALAVMGQVSRQGVLLLVALALFGIGQVLLGQSASFLMALVVVTFVNALAAVTDVLHQSLIQLSVSNEQRGRAMGSWIVGIGTAPVGQLQIGYLAELTNARIALLVNGVALTVLAFIMGVIMPRLRRL
jgi:sugar phosphate permease